MCFGRRRVAMPDVYDFKFTDQALTTYTLVRQAWVNVNRLAEAKLGKVGLTPETLAVLWAASDYPGTLIPAEIARLTHRENQTIAGLLNRMEKAGLIQRIPKRKGKPFTEVKITDKGRELCDAGVPIFKAMVTDLISDMPVKMQKECQEWHRILRDKALDRLHLEAVPAVVGVPGKPIRVKW
jgi:DNA-binding MarR family transcriptional regulator